MIYLLLVILLILNLVQLGALVSLSYQLNYLYMIVANEITWKLRDIEEKL